MSPHEATESQRKAGTTRSVLPLLLLDVRRGYKSGSGRLEVLKGVSLVVGNGELVMVAGPSGSGKSTLLCIMGGLLRAEEGSVEIFGRDITKFTESQVREARCKEIGFVFQNIYLMPALSSVENVRIVMDIKGKENKSAIDLLNLVGAGKLAKKHPRELSGGERQRVAIARALVGTPRIILADEPTSSLDTDSAMSIMDLLRRLVKDEGLSVVVVAHDVRLFEYADRVFLLEAGRVREAGKDE